MQSPISFAMQRINFRREPQENDMGKSPAAPTAKGADRNARLAAELRANLMKRKAQSRKRDRARSQEKSPGTTDER